MTETVEIRNKTRRVKDHILNRYLKLADKVDDDKVLDSEEQKLYDELTMTFARNVVPRSQEVTGEDGEPIAIKASITGMKIIQDTSGGDRVSHS